MNNSILTKGALAGLAINGGGFLLAMALQLALARFMTPEGFGVYSWILSLLNIVVVIGVGGVDGVFLQELPGHVHNKRFGDVDALLKWGWHRSIKASVAAGALLLFIVWWLFQDFDLLLVALLGAVMMLVWAQNAIRQTVIRSFFSIFKARFPDVILRPLILLCAVCSLIFILDDKVNAAQVMLLHLFAVIVSFALGFYLSIKLLNGSTTGVSESSEAQSWNKSATILLYVSLVAIVIAEIDKVLIGHFMSLEQVGNFSVASRLAVLTLFTQDAIAAVAAPLISKARSVDGFGSLKEISKKITQWSIFTAMPILFSLLVAGSVLLSLFGERFVQVYPALVIMSSVYFISLFFGPGGYILTMSGHQKSCLRGSIITVLAQVALILVAISTDNFSVIALASASAILMRAVTMWWLVKKHLGFSCSLLL